MLLEHTLALAFDPAALTRDEIARLALGSPARHGDAHGPVVARGRQPASGPEQRMLRVRGLTLDLTRRVADSGDGPVVLSEREFLLLEYLMRRDGDVCTRQRLLADVWGYSFDPGSNVVDVCVGRLRGKLRTDVIETVRSVGYRLNAA